jgi:hypothetical protein
MVMLCNFKDISLIRDKTVMGIDKYLDGRWTFLRGIHTFSKGK